MAKSITVNAETLKKKASELHGMNTKFKKQVSALRTEEKGLNKMWDGDANDAFHAAFEKDATQMDNFYNAIEKYISSLKEIAAAYEKAERTNTNTATKRKY
jgi:WXG100 family type VII secretion target